LVKLINLKAGWEKKEERNISRNRDKCVENRKDRKVEDREGG
jgi:hypothetical protein